MSASTVAGHLCPCVQAADGRHEGSPSYDRACMNLEAVHLTPFSTGQPTCMACSSCSCWPCLIVQNNSASPCTTTNTVRVVAHLYMRIQNINVLKNGHDVCFTAGYHMQTGYFIHAFTLLRMHKAAHSTMLDGIKQLLSKKHSAVASSLEPPYVLAVQQHNSQALTSLGLSATWPSAQAEKPPLRFAPVCASAHSEPSGKAVSPPSPTSGPTPFSAAINKSEAVIACG